MFNPCNMTGPRIWQDEKVIGIDKEIADKNIDYIRKTVGSFYLNSVLQNKENAEDFIKCTSWYSKRFSGSYNRAVEADLIQLMDQKGLLTKTESQEMFQQGYGAAVVPNFIPEYVTAFTDPDLLDTLSQIERETVGHAHLIEDQPILNAASGLNEDDINDWVDQNKQRGSLALK